MKKWKELNYREGNEQIAEIEDLGHHVHRHTDFHWKINGKIDVWPTTKKFMVNGIVKKYKEIKDIFL